MSIANRIIRRHAEPAPRPVPPTPLVRVTTAFEAGPFAGLLPAPRIPRNNAPASADVATVVGDELAAPLVKLEAAVVAATNALNELEHNRPGPLGDGWTAAMAADAADHAAGKPSKEFRSARLLKSDPDRWAAAHVAARFVSVAARQCEQALDRAEIATTAARVARQHAAAFAEHAEEGWNARERRAEAWRCYDLAQEAAAAFEEASAVAEWAKPGSSPELTPEARGFWEALHLALHPQQRLLSAPTDIDIPEGAHKLFGMAYVPDQGLANLREHGHNEIGEIA